MFTIHELLDVAGETIFGRGEDYVRYVHGLQTHADHADASIQAKRVYTVRLTWSDDGIGGDCTCPFRADGRFCKHLVAVGLAVLGEGRTPQLADEATDVIHDYLAGLDHDALLELVEELTLRDEAALRTVQARALAAGAHGAVDPDELVALVRDTLPSGFVDYRQSFDVARNAHQVLDDLERIVAAGGADQARPALERAVKRLRQVILNADDSSGSLGDACQRAAELHARSCREGSPDVTKLARWLVKFRADSPGWPDLTLQMYVSALDERALQVYRRAVAKLDADQAGHDRFSRFELDAMLLELADHDGDVDEAVRLLSRDGEHIAYGSIVDRLDAAGRTGEALAWLDRAAADNRVSHHVGRGERNPYWIAPADAAERYLAAGRGEDVIAVLRAAFEQQPGPVPLRELVDAGERLGCAAEQRAWALARAEVRAEKAGDGSALVRIALAEGDLVAAWAAVERFGAGGAWRELADASEDDLPIAAADLYRLELERMLRDANTRVYPAVAGTLAKMRTLYAKVDEQATIDALVAEIRERYRRRTSLIAQLDRAGLR